MIQRDYPVYSAGQACIIIAVHLVQMHRREPHLTLPRLLGRRLVRKRRLEQQIRVEVRLFALLEGPLRGRHGQLLVHETGQARQRAADGQLEVLNVERACCGKAEGQISSLPIVDRALLEVCIF